jgi:hypothetical protein
LVFKYVLNFLCRIARGTALKDSEIAARSKTITQAFERALQQLLYGHSSHTPELDIAFARSAVRVSHYQCGPVARAAEAVLLTMGLEGVQFHFTGFHYGLFDTQSGLFYDLETPHGCSDTSKLPILRRTEDLGRVSMDGDQKDVVFEQYARDWLNGKRCHT